MKKKFIKLIIVLLFFSCSTLLMAQETTEASEKAMEAYNKPNYLEPDELFNRAKQCLTDGKLDDARLYALRLYFDGVRNTNLLNLLGMVEIQAGRPLLASEWLRKSSALTMNNKVAQKYLSRLPQKPRPIPVDPAKLTDHFTEISEGLPKLIEKLSNSKIHYEAILKAIERGQLYLALALSEEYEKKYPKTADGYGLSALCAWYLGKNGDASRIIEDKMKEAPYNPLMLFVKAMINDFNTATFAGSYFRALYDYDQWEKALGLVDQYSKLNPYSAEAYIARARILLDLYKTKEVGEVLQEAGKRDPGNPEIEILWVNYLIQRNEKEKAARRMVNAFKRGYNLPSINLSAGIFAMQDGRVDEVNLILDEATSCLPFNESEAYPIYISLTLTIDRLSDARKALNYWKPRSGEKSMYCYMEAFYSIKNNNVNEAIEWLRKAFKLNPYRIDVLRFFVALPIIEQEDPNLYAQLNNKLAELQQGFISMKVPERVIHQPVPKKELALGIANTSEPIVSGNFKISFGAGINPESGQSLLEDMNEMYNRIASRIGTITEPINVKYVSAEKLGPMIINYDVSKDVITITSNYYDEDMIRNVIRANFDSFGNEELNKVIDEYPKHLLASNICRYMINHICKNARNSNSKNYWLEVGLSEILAGSKSALRYRLLVAKESIENKTANFVELNKLNTIFLNNYSSPASIETATVQSYLMTCYLVKKAGLGKGCKKIIELINKVSDGADFVSIIKEAFNINFMDFNINWKEAGKWAIDQGAPYEWE